MSIETLSMTITKTEGQFKSEDQISIILILQIIQTCNKSIIIITGMFEANILLVAGGSI